MSSTPVTSIFRIRGLLSCASTLAIALAVVGPMPQLGLDSGDGLPVQSAPLQRVEESPIPSTPEPAAFVSDEVLLQFDPFFPPEALQQTLESQSFTIIDTIEAIGVKVIQVPADQVASSIDALANLPGVVAVEPNYLAEMTDTIPNDPDWIFQYGSSAIHAPQGWDINTGSNSVTIAIIDTGIDLTHPDLAGKIVAGYDFVNSDFDPQDDNGHGTHVSGIAAAITNNSLGVAGISWGAKLMPLKALNAFGNGTFDDVAAAIVWAADHGAQVVNLSLGGTNPSTILQSAVEYANAKGCVVIAAAGNTGSSVLYPARYPSVIAVGATDNNNLHPAFSNTGPELSVSAPGVQIYSTLPLVLGGYGYKSGTSMSTPYTSGLVAILIGLGSSWSPDSIRTTLETTALDLGAPGKDNEFGYGLIQMDAAIQVLLPTSTPEITDTSAPPASSGQEQIVSSPTPTATLELPPLTETPVVIPEGTADLYIQVAPSQEPSATLLASATVFTTYTPTATKAPSQTASITETQISNISVPTVVIDIAIPPLATATLELPKTGLPWEWGLLGCGALATAIVLLLLSHRIRK